MSRSVSVILPSRSNAAGTSRALSGIVLAFSSLGIDPQVILIDDHSSDPELWNTLSKFKEKTRFKDVILAQTAERFHYTGVFSLGLHLATNNDVFFMSNDMILTTSFIKALFAVAYAEESNGIVRGTSNHTDSHPEHTVVPPKHSTRLSDLNVFADARYAQFGNAYVADHLLSGDAILIKRSVLNKIGVLDTRFFGYFGDVDFGLRAQLAGFKLVCAKGAWLYHEGAGHVKDESKKSGLDFNKIYDERMALVNAAFGEFRAKWGLPEKFTVSDFELSFPEIIRKHASLQLEPQSLPAGLLEHVRVS